MTSVERPGLNKENVMDGSREVKMKMKITGTL